MGRAQRCGSLSLRLVSSLAGCMRESGTRAALGMWSSAGAPWRACVPGALSGLHLRHFADLPPHTIMSMPALSPTMTQGNIAKWLKKEGDQLAAGQVLAEVETDKATMDWEGQEDGYLAKIIAGDGAKDIPVGGAVAVLVEEEKWIAAFKDYTVGSASASKPAAAAASEAAPPAHSAPPAAAAPPPPPAKAKSTWPAHQVMSMPALSPTMTQGNIIEWKKQVGDTVAPGDVLCDVETDKATMAWEAQEEGFVAKILAPGGTNDIPLGTVVAILVEEKELIAAFENYTAADASGGASAAPEPAAAAPPAAAAAASPPPPPQQQQASSVSSSGASGERVLASPYAKKLAAGAGITLSGISATGPNGRIVAADVQKAIQSDGATSSAPAKASGAGAAASSSSASDYTDTSNTNIRKITAKRLLESKQTVPHYYLTMECKMDALQKLREQINSQAAASGVKVSVNDLIIKASALALRKVPTVNSSWNPDYIRQYHYVDVSVAVQTPTGLMVPIVKDADKKGLAAISADVRALAAKAKEGKLQPAEFMGGTFTVSNLGMFGVKQFCAIINPPQAAILAVGGTDKKVVMNKAGGFEEVTVMMVTLSCDHRVVDGAAGSEWLQAFKAFIENPYTMLL